jgi:outer membrane protein assembly factor BamB
MHNLGVRCDQGCSIGHRRRSTHRRSGCVFRRRGRELHLPRQRRCIRHIDGQDAVESVHRRRGAQAGRNQCRWRSPDGTVGGGDLVGADLRCGHPRVYATTGDNYSDPPIETSDAIVGFDAGSGELAWTHQITSGDASNIARNPPVRDNCPKANGPDFDFGSSVVLANLPDGKRVLVAGQKSGLLTALDPDHGGEIVWQKRVGGGGKIGGVQWGIAVDDSNVYVAASDVRLSVVTPETPGAQPYVFHPKITLLYDSTVGGGLSALKLDTGEQVWRTPHPGSEQSRAVGRGDRHPGLVF